MDADVFASDLVFVVANAKLFNLSVFDKTFNKFRYFPLYGLFIFDSFDSLVVDG